jgi:hypothetical protein
MVLEHHREMLGAVPRVAGEQDGDVHARAVIVVATS